MRKVICFQGWGLNLGPCAWCCLARQEVSPRTSPPTFDMLSSCSRGMWCLSLSAVTTSLLHTGIFLFLLAEGETQLGANVHSVIASGHAEVGMQVEGWTLGKPEATGCPPRLLISTWQAQDLYFYLMLF